MVMPLALRALWIGVSQVKGKLLRLAIITIMAGLLSLAMIGIVQDFLSAESFKLTIAVVNEDQNADMAKLMKLIIGNDIIEDTFHIVEVDSAREGEALLEANQVVAMVTLPDGFLNSVLVGTNLSPSVAISSDDPVYQAVMENLVRSLAQVMVQTQSGIYASIDALRSQGLYNDDFILTVNWLYVSFLMESEYMYDHQDVSYTQVLSMPRHYQIATVLFLLVLSLALFLPELSVGWNLVLLRHIAVHRRDYAVLYFARVLVIYLVYVALFAGATVWMGGDLSWLYLFALSQGVALIVLVGAVIASVCRTFVTANQVHSLVHIGSWVAIGGVIPPLFLPQVVLTVGAYTPMAQLQTIFTGIYLRMKWADYGCTGLLICNGVLLVVLCWLLARAVKGDADGI